MNNNEKDTLPSTNDLEQSNQRMIELLRNNKKFLVNRIGTNELVVSKQISLGEPIRRDYMINLVNNAGIYNPNQNLKTYSQKYLQSLKNSTYLAYVEYVCQGTQKHYIQEYNLATIHSRALEPFYYCHQKIIPWSHYLLGKKVLIVSPFTDSIQKQMDRGFQVFPDRPIFLKGQEFVLYKCFQTCSGNNPHSSWEETFHVMCSEIEKLDFDIALLSCGGYGMLLSDYIYSELGKSAIYIGGGLQLLFGVMGKRWESLPIWREIMKTNKGFIKPSGDELPENRNIVEGGCYW